MVREVRSYISFQGRTRATTVHRRLRALTQDACGPILLWW
jgi:hypothetical protein